MYSPEEKYREAEKAIAKVDKKAEALKQSILNAESVYPTDGKVYYVSPLGNDANDGLSPEKAWKTVKRVSDADELRPGDAVLFERDRMFRGAEIAPPAATVTSVVCREGVTYSAYGEGAKPVINCSPEDGTGAANWEKVEGTEHIWRYKNKLMDVGMIYFDGGVRCGVKQIPDCIGGKYYVRDTNGEKEYDFKTELKENFDFFSECNKVLYENGVPNCYVPQNKGDLYLYCDMGNPGEVFGSIEFAVKKHGLRIGGSGVTVDNLCILYAGAHGIAAGTTENLTVRNCEIGWIGGVIQCYQPSGRVVRFGNGIEIYGGCKHYTVEHNYIYQCYDAGATHQFSAVGKNDVIMEDTVYKDNLFEYCIYSIEYFLGKAESEDTTRYMRHTVIKDNLSRFAGFGFGEQRPDKGSAAHIKSWDHYNRSDDFIIENNIFDRSRHMTIHISAFDAAWLPALKNNTYIQHRDFTGTLGRFGTAPTENIPYTDDVGEYLAANGIEKGAKVFFAPNDALCDIPNK